MKGKATYILLLLPVPRSIMICLFLPNPSIVNDPANVRGEKGRSRDLPVEEHEGTWIVQFVHLPFPISGLAMHGRKADGRGKAYFVEIWDFCDIHYGELVSYRSIRYVQ
jgi:hypothetical protein